MGTVSSGERSKRWVYTEGDQRMLEHLHHVRWSLAEDLAVAVDRSVAKVRQRLSLLKANRLVTFDRPTLGAAAWRVTGVGHEVAALDPPVPAPLRAFVWTHTLTVSALSAALVAEGVAHRVDHQLRAHVAECRGTWRQLTDAAVSIAGRWQVPDLLVDLPGDERLAIEIELSGKGAERLRSILAAYWVALRPVIYLARPHVARSIERQSERVAEASMIERGLLTVWPAPVLEATATKPARPYSEAARELAREIRARVASHQPRVVEPQQPRPETSGCPMAPPPGWYRR